MMDRHGQRPMILAQFVMAVLVAVVATEDDDSVKLEKVSALSGRTAELPCDITPPALDSLYLVLWYKNNSDFPIYKYDARRSRESYRQQETQRDNQMFLLQQQQQLGQESSAGRIHFQFDSHPALLLLSNVGDPDEGNYRCRVDFGRSPTRNVLVQLTVVVPPQKIRIIEDNRQVSSVIGPYDEGDQLSLNCIVTGGRPRPEVSWWLNDKLVDNTYMATSENVVQNILVIPQLERHHLHAILRCQASNYFGVHNNTPPFAVQSYGYKKQQKHHSSSSHHSRHQQQHTIVSSVQLDLNLRPLWVLITGAEKPLSVGKSYTFECITGGSRPSVNVRWYLHSIQQPSKERVTMDGSNTTSTLKLMPTAKDHDAELICVAINPVLAARNGSIGNNGSISSVETHRRLIVHFAPTAELELGRNLKPDSIAEGNDVYFDCRIRSNPPPLRFLWTHEGQTIRENAAAGVIIVEQSLVIRRVSRSHSGRYSCTAVNTEGSGVSNTVQLRVMFQPVCRPGQKILYGVAKHEKVVVQCQTDAIPPAHSHRWAFNTSLSDAIELQDNQMFQTTSPIEEGAEADGTSVISYSPQSDRDYGSLICWARNVIGEQREPCVYRIFLGVRPDPPSNCSVLNQTAEAVEVWCRPGFDGGHPQLFQFEIFDTQSAVLLYNKSGRYPHLRVGNLESGIKLFIQVSAFNQRGRSPLVPLEAYTIKIADKQTVIMETRDWASILGIASGVSATILIVCIAIGLTARFRRQNHQPNHDRPHPIKMDRINDTTITVNADAGDELQHNNEDPDIIINSNSVHEQQFPEHLNHASSSAGYRRNEAADWTQRENESTHINYCTHSDIDKPIVVGVQYYHSLNRQAETGKPWMTDDLDTIVSVKTPYRQKQIPVHLL